MNKIYSLALLFCFYAAKAEIEIPAIFADHMVLQRNAEIKIWGWSDLPDAIVIAGSWDLQTSTECIVQHNGYWSAIIKTTNAGGPYTLTISSRYSQIHYRDIMLGEVWLISGQSNMAINLKDIDADTSLSQDQQYDIRFFNVGRKLSESPEKNCKGKWESSLQSPGNCSAVGFHFAQNIQRRLKVPVGLINASWGCTHIEQWIDKKVLSGDPEVTVSARINADCDIQGIGNLFNTMIFPIIPYTFKGVLWYQGESNRFYPGNYEKLFRTLIESWRIVAGYEFPFYYVQLAPYACKEKAYLIREAQAKTLAMPNTGMVVISDLVDDINDIHPLNKADVGRRLAAQVLGKTYRQKMRSFESPLYKSYSVKKGKIILRFNHEFTRFRKSKTSSKSFLISAADKHFLPAVAKIRRRTIIVWSSSVNVPVAVRYDFDNISLPDVFSKSGLPLGIFRTDAWETP